MSASVCVVWGGEVGGNIVEIGVDEIDQTFKGIWGGDETFLVLSISMYV
jgi:hypothetical protein